MMEVGIINDPVLPNYAERVFRIKNVEAILHELYRATIDAERNDPDRRFVGVRANVRSMHYRISLDNWAIPYPLALECCQNILYASPIDYNPHSCCRVLKSKCANLFASIQCNMLYLQASSRSKKLNRSYVEVIQKLIYLSQQTATPGTRSPLQAEKTIIYSFHFSSTRQFFHIFIILRRFNFNLFGSGGGKSGGGEGGGGG